MVMIETDELGPHEMSPERWPVDKRRKYAISMILRVKREFQDDIERSLAYIDKVKNLGIWKWANAESLDEYIATGGLTPDDIEYYRVGVSRLRGEGHQGKITQKDIGRALAESVEPMRSNGEAGNGRSSFDNIKATQGGTNAEYTAARLKRDHPELGSTPRPELLGLGNLRFRSLAIPHIECCGTRILAATRALWFCSPSIPMNPGINGW